MRALALSAAVLGFMTVSAGAAWAMCECCKKMMAPAAQQGTSPSDQMQMPMTPAPAPTR